MPYTDKKILSIIQQFIDDTKDDWNYITPEEYKDIREKGDAGDYYLLDIRRPEDYKKGHIPGAWNIFWLDLFKSENLKKLPKDKKILIYCYVGHTSSQVLPLLKLLGYDVVSLKFGLGQSPTKGVPVAGWSDFGYKTTKKGSTMNKLSSMLDKVAESLEKKGLLKEAEEIDVISNTVDNSDITIESGQRPKGPKPNPWYISPQEQKEKMIERSRQYEKLRPAIKGEPWIEGVHESPSQRKLREQGGMYY